MTGAAKSCLQGAIFQMQWQRGSTFVRKRTVNLVNKQTSQRQAHGPNGQIQFVGEYAGDYSREIEPHDPNQATGRRSHLLD